MNKEQTIELAKQAGWTELGADLWGATHDGAMSTYALQRFAALVRADTALEAEPTPVQECGYDETTGSCTRNPCCAVAPVQEPEISDAQASLLASALGECILASGIVGKDKDGFSGPELLMFAEDLKQMLERSRQPAQEPRSALFRYLDQQVAKDMAGFYTALGLEAPAHQPHKAVKLSDTEMREAFNEARDRDEGGMACFRAIETAVLAKNGLES